MFIVSAIYRNPSNGSENWYTKNFATIDEASYHICNVWYPDFCELNYYPDHWDDSDFDCPMPDKNDFSVESIITRKSSVLFSAYSKHYAIIPNELRIEERKGD